MSSSAIAIIANRYFLSPSLCQSLHSQKLDMSLSQRGVQSVGVCGGGEGGVVLGGGVWT